MPLVVTDAPQISTYNLLSFLLDILNKPERAPCMGAFSCCAREHTVLQGERRRRIPCDKKFAVQVLNRMYIEKVQHQFKLAPVMCYIACGLEHTIYAGAEGLKELLRKSPLMADESETVEAFAGRVGFGSLHARGGNDQDLLQVAVWMHHQSVVRKLLALRSPGEPWHRNVVNNNAFEIAVIAGSLDMTQSMLATGDIGEGLMTVPNVVGGTILQTAAENGHAELVHLLLERRAEVDFPKLPHSTCAGRTALHCASMNCWSECCKILLEHGAYVHVRDAQGCTPYSLVVRERPVVIGNNAPGARSETVRVLLEARANPETDDSSASLNEALRITCLRKRQDS